MGDKAMDSTFILHDVGASINTGPDGSVPVHVCTPASSISEKEIQRLINILLRICDSARCRTQIEQISVNLYNERLFENLQTEALRNLVNIARSLVSYREQVLLEYEQSIPTGLSRICPHCGNKTWQAAQCCLFCHYDLVLHDDQYRAKINEKRKTKTALFFVGLAFCSFGLGWTQPQENALWANLTALVLLLFSVKIKIHRENKTSSKASDDPWFY